MLRLTKPLLWETIRDSDDLITRRSFPLYGINRTSRGWEFFVHDGWLFKCEGVYPSRSAAKKAAQSFFEKYVTGFLKRNALRVAYRS